MIYDCFSFFNELDLLEIRLNELHSIVDKFVLVEATRTHQNKTKPLYFSDNKSRFKQFESKIIHVIVNEYPSFFTKFRKPSSWDIERHQRNQIIQGLKECKPDDIILVSDMDEIPDPTKISLFKDRMGLKVFRQKNYYYYVNCVGKQEEEKWWYGTVMAHFRDFKKPQQLRKVSNKMHAEGLKILENKAYRNLKSITEPIFKKNISIIDQAGWHFSYLGGAEKIIEKLEAFAHSEFNKSEFKNKNSIQHLIESGKDILGRGNDFEFVPLDSSFPDYLTKNQERFRELIFDSGLNNNKSK